MGVDAPDEGLGLATVEVAEDDERWPRVRAWASKASVLDVVSTSFSKDEQLTASWSNLTPTWHRGYPQPEQDFEYLRVTYDLAASCSKCGVGVKQKAPFRMKGEPRWGRNSILQLNWVFGEFFVTPALWSRVFKVHGVGCGVVLDKRGNPLESVVQLMAEEEVSVDVSGRESETCPTCGRTKCHPIARGRFPPLRSQPRGQFCRTVEWFGSGASADRMVLVGRTLASALIADGARGASLHPCEEPQRA